MLEDEVRELIRRRGIDPLREPEALSALVTDAVTDYDERSLRGHVPPLADAEAAAKAVVDAVAGLGPLQRYLEDDTIEEIWINSPSSLIIRGRRTIGWQESAESPQTSAGASGVHRHTLPGSIGGVRHREELSKCRGRTTRATSPVG